MKTQLTALLTLLLFAGTVSAQTELAPDQNPNYAVSRDKYMQMADSVNRWHSTTLQNTYEANDFLANKEKARKDRAEFRRQLRLERARWNGYDYRNDGYFYPSYNSRNNNYYDPYYNNNRNYRWQRNRYWWW